MSLLRRTRVGTRLALAFALVLLMLVAMLAIGLHNMGNAQRDTQRIVRQDFRKTQLTSVALDNARGSIARLFQRVQDSEDAASAQALARFQANVKASKDALDELEPLLDDGKSKALMGQARETGRAYLTTAQAIHEALEGGRRDEARTLAYRQAYPALHAFATALRDLNDNERARLEANGQHSAEAYVAARNALLVIGALAIALAVAAAWAATRSITQPLRVAAAAVERVGAGDLTVQIHDAGRDETAQLLQALGRMVARLQGVVGSVRTSVDAFAHTSEEIAAGNQDLSMRTEQAAASLQQTASSMEELNGTVRQSSDSAAQANRLAADAAEVARRGGSSMGQVVGTMEEISTASRRIADIIGVIDGIAFQTNILALNAAVEAARAGEQGRGFAVVAGEVRQLAQRSGEAAREIKALIGASTERVEAGRRMVRDAGETMQAIVASVEQVTTIVHEIANAASEQSDGIGQVSVAVAQLDQVTQQNAALVEESAAAAASLKAQAVQLTEVVSVFRVERDAAGTSRLPASASADAPT